MPTLMSLLYQCAVALKLIDYTIEHAGNKLSALCSRIVVGYFGIFINCHNGRYRGEVK